MNTRKPDYQKAKKEAQNLLNTLGYTDPPVSPLDIAAFLGLSVVEVVLPNQYKRVAGFIDIPEAKIFVNKEDPVNRKIFTIAHEIGHYVLHSNEIEQNPDTYQVLFRNFSFEVENPLEKEANVFAANLLVPMSMLERFRNYSASILSGLFNVSQQVINFRLQDTNFRSKWAA